MDTAAGAPDGHSQAASGRSLQRTIKDLNPLLQGWIGHFRMRQGGYPGRLRLVATATAVLSAVAAVEASVHAPTSADCVGARPRAGMEPSVTGRGLWWHAVTAHTNHALPTLYFTPWGWSRCSAASSAWVMNRHMRNRAYDGARGPEG